MPTFRQVKVHATVETEAMLLRDDQIGGVLNDLRDKLQHLDLTVLSIEPAEPAPMVMAATVEEDAWGIRGRPVD